MAATFSNGTIGLIDQCDTNAGTGWVDGGAGEDRPGSPLERAPIKWNRTPL